MRLWSRLGLGPGTSYWSADWSGSNLASKKIISKRSLEIKLAKLETLENPKLGLEQYPVSPEAASELLYMAGFEHNDLAGKVVDLGTGTGRLAIGAAMVGAVDVLGLDVDKNSIQVAARNADLARVEVDWVVGDLDCVTGDFQTVLMNPPYGTRSPHLDTRFLSRAFELAPVSYSIHKSSTRSFLVEFARKNGRRVDEVRSLGMRIPHLFDFHRKKWETIQVDLYRLSAK
jgi:putative methylase